MLTISSKVLLESDQGGQSLFPKLPNTCLD
jgi:hypothetical protein